MPGITALVTLLSLDITQALVNVAEMPYASFELSNATNTSPIVVTTTEPHGFNVGQSIHCVIAEVEGNEAANGTWIGTATGATTIALYSMDPYGQIQNSTGDGAYTSGGTLETAFVDGCAVVGQQHVAEVITAPRLIFVPMGSTFSRFSTARQGGGRTIGGGPYTNEAKNQLLGRMLWNDKQNFMVYASGVNDPANPDTDFDIAQLIYQQVIRSAFYLTGGDIELTSGEWVDQLATATQLDKFGHQYRFKLTIGTPIPDYSLLFVPSGTISRVTTQIQVPPASTPEVAWEGDVPGEGTPLF
jgi:hypothetical protein